MIHMERWVAIAQKAYEAWWTSQIAENEAWPNWEYLDRGTQVAWMAAVGCASETIPAAQPENVSISTWADWRPPRDLPGLTPEPLPIKIRDDNAVEGQEPPQEKKKK